LQRHLQSVVRPIKVEPLPNHQLRVFYRDGAQGVIDLSSHVGHGVFAPLADEAFFKTGHIGKYGQIAWTDDLEICPDTAYLEISALQKD
jgi:Protein of unknown function (DUF2442)